MKLLFITGNLPYPPTDGWRIRVFAILRALASRGHDVTVASFMRAIDDAKAAERLREYVTALHVIPRSHRYSSAKLVRGLIGRTAFPIVNYCDERMVRVVEDVLRRESFDLVQAESLHMAQYCLDLECPTILDLHNIESLLMKRYARHIANPLKRLYAEVTWRKLAAYEREVCRRFTHCLTCSDEERVLLQTCAGVESITVVPNGVHIADYAATPPSGHNGGREPERIVFVGRMDYHANVEGVRWFCHQVLPRIRKKRPAVVFQIVGGHPVPAISRLAMPGAVEVTGFVTDVRPYLTEASVMIAPLRIGGGTRLKILEALAMGKAVVTTTLGVEGIEATPGRDLLIADRPSEFADQVVALLENPDLRQRIGSAGRRLIKDKYDWDVIVAHLEHLYESRVASGRAVRNAVPVA